MTLAVVLVLLVVASIIFHFWSPWWFTPLASNWTSIDSTIDITFWVTGSVFVAVNFFLAYVVYRYRYQKNRRAHYQPENKRLELWLTAVTALGVVAMLAPGLVVWAKFVEVPDDAAEVEVLGQQWQWGFRFPGADGRLGSASIRYVSQSNPFGLDPGDPNSQDDRLIMSSELHLPVDQSVKVLLRSKDVLHNFAVPQFRVKMDLVPGTISYLWFAPSRLGRFDILCMELCGLAHHAMRGQVVVESRADFQAWLQRQPTFYESQQGKVGDAAAGRQLYGVCAACHGEKGEGRVAMNAPRLSGLADWYLVRQLRYYRQGIRGAHPQDSYGQQMAAMAKILADDQAVKDVAAYVAGLAGIAVDGPVEKTKASDSAERGASYYVTCGACHGRRGEGNFSLGAPRLAGQQSWYLKRQLMSFRRGMRGAHGQDRYGSQMIMMAAMLRDEQAIDDVLTHIEQL